MNFIDLLVFLGALILGVRGYRRGAVLEGLEAASAFGGVALAYRLRDGLGASLAISTGLSLAVARGVVFIATAFAVASAGFALAGWLSRRVPKTGPWGAADGFGGLAFGAAKAAAYAALLVVLVAQIPLGFISDWTYGSAFCRAVFALMPGLVRSVGGWV